MKRTRGLWASIIFVTILVVLSLVGFFVIGGWLLSRVDVDAARESRLRWSFEGDEATVT